MIYEKFMRILYVDLSTGKIRIEKREDLMPYLGGVGIASKLLEENMRPELDALDQEQPIVFAIGAGTWMFPVLTKTVAMFRSPLTNELGESYAGGRLAMTMFMAGYDAIVLTGKSLKPVYLQVSSNDVQLKDARAMWGLQSEATGQAIRDRQTGGGKRSIIRIGPAGENKVAFASVCVDSYRHFGRLGLGAVMGSKNLKAMTVIGDRSIHIQNTQKYFKVYQQIFKKCTSTDMMAKYHDAGTPINIASLNAAGALPTLNLQAGTFEQGEQISGEAFAKKNLVRKLACTGCPVGCIHIGMYRREFDKGHEYEAISVSYDYELIFALGSFLGIQTSDEIIALIDEVEETGMDAMSCGVCLGWATEAFSNGLITEEQTLVKLAFGDAGGYLQAIRHLAHGKNKFYRDLGRGSQHASSVYGGSDYAMQIAGNEMPGYHSGYGALVGAAVGARHSHLCNGGYSIDQSMKEFDETVMVDKIFNEEVERCMTNSLIMCLFARKVYDRQTILDALNSVGWNLTDQDLTDISKRIYRTKLRIKNAYGFRQKAVKLPKRFFETPSMHGPLDEKTAQHMIKDYTAKTDALMLEADPLLTQPPAAGAVPDPGK
ncbi:MAG: aldehyde ferredoxin oxidoreductase C-terminal domain-containing protein [Eubacteriales bacterium]